MVESKKEKMKEIKKRTENVCVRVVKEERVDWRESMIEESCWRIGRSGKERGLIGLNER